MNSVRNRGSRKRNVEGGTLVLVTVFIVALFAFAAMSIDMGNVYVQRNRLQEAGDSAAMASVVDWAQGGSASVVAQRAISFASANGVPTNEVIDVRVGTWDHATRTFTAVGTFTSSQVPAVEVTNQRLVPMHFGRVIGISSMNPKTVSVAVVAAASGAAGALPWAACNSFVPTKCMTVTVQFKDDSGVTNACEGGSGNFGQLTLGDPGADNYRNNIEYGYSGVLRVGDCVDTDTGVSWGPTKQGIDDRLSGQSAYTCTSTSPPPIGDGVPSNDRRQAIIPVVDTLDLSGKKQVCITGFYVVSLDGYQNSDKSVTITFLEAYNGTEVNPGRPPIPGMLNGVALVK